MSEILRVGLDVGSTTVKIVILDEKDNILYSKYQRHYSDIRKTIYDVLTEAFSKYEAICQASVRRRAVLKGIQQESETILRSFFGKAQRSKHLLLQRPVMDSDTAAANFISVQNDIVGACPNAARIAFYFIAVLRQRRRKRMMHRNIALLFLRIFEQREFRDPQKGKAAFIDQAELFSELAAKRSKHGIDGVAFSGNDTDQIARPGARKRDDRRDFFRGKNL